MPRITYVELPTRDVAATKLFYASAFGCAMTDFGPSYAATTDGDVDLGLQGDGDEAPAAPLVIFTTDDLEAQLAAVETAGGTITKPIFAFPGGRRFHFRDPAGNELAALMPD